MSRNGKPWPGLLGFLGINPRPDGHLRSPSRSDTVGLHEILAQPVEDREIQMQINLLYRSIHGHASKYYEVSLDNENATGDQDENLMVKKQQEADTVNDVIISQLEREIFPEDRRQAVIVARMLSRTEQRLAGIQILIGKAILSNIDFYGDPATTLLPKETVTILRAHKSLHRRKDYAVADQIAVSQWRLISTYLLTDKHNEQSALKSSARGIDFIVEALNTILQNYVKADYKNDDSGKARVSHLHAVVHNGAQFGLLLFAQPNIWEFDWSSPRIPTPMPPPPQSLSAERVLSQSLPDNPSRSFESRPPQSTDNRASGPPLAYDKYSKGRPESVYDSQSRVHRRSLDVGPNPYHVEQGQGSHDSHIRPAQSFQGFKHAVRSSNGFGLPRTNQIKRTESYKIHRKHAHGSRQKSSLAAGPSRGDQTIPAEVRMTTPTVLFPALRKASDGEGIRLAKPITIYPSQVDSNILIGY